MNTPGSTVDIKTQKTRKLGSYRINYWKHFEELPNKSRLSGSLVACNHDISCWTSKNHDQAWFSVRLKNSTLSSKQQYYRTVKEDSSSKICRHSVLAETAIGSNLINQIGPEWPSGPRTPTKPQNKFFDTVTVFNYILSTQYDGTHKSDWQSLPVKGCLRHYNTVVQRPNNKSQDVNLLG